MGSHGYLWVPMGLVGFYGFSWFFMFFESPKDILGHSRYIWVHLGSHGYLWFPIGFVGSPGFLGFL